MESLTSYTDAYHPQPLPGPLAAGPRPTDPQAVVLAAVWLLAAWSPAGAPGWRAEFAHADAFDGDPVHEVAALLTEWIPAPDGRTRALRELLIGELDGKYVQLRRVAGEDLVLLLHDWRERTLRITVTRADAVEAPPEGSRLPSLMTLLSSRLWVNNNNPVTFRAFVAEHGGRTDPAAWWTATREEAEDEAPDFEVYDLETIRTALLNVARGGLGDLVEDWNGDGEYPALPADHIAAHLSHDLLDALAERIGQAERVGQGGRFGPGSVHGTGFLPTDWDDQDEDAEIGTVVLVGERAVAVLDIDVSC